MSVFFFLFGRHFHVFRSFCFSVNMFVLKFFLYFPICGFCVCLYFGFFVLFFFLRDFFIFNSLYYYLYIFYHSSSCCILPPLIVLLWRLVFFFIFAFIYFFCFVFWFGVGFKSIFCLFRSIFVVILFLVLEEEYLCVLVFFLT